jgi:TonB family protein
MMQPAMLSNLFAWSLQALSVVLVGGALPRLLRLHAPGVRYGYWRALLMTCLILPVVQPWQPVASLDAAPGPPAAMLSSAPRAPSSSTAPASRVSALRFEVQGDRWPAAIAAVLVAGAALRLAWLVAGLFHLRRLRRAGVRRVLPDEQNDGEQDDLHVLASAGADVRYVRGLGQPVTFGVLRPVVLLPQSLRSQPPAVQRAVVVHELWHVRRRDWLWVVIEETVRAVLWFHPAITWLVSRVQSSREEVVDELTVLATNARRSYLEALLIFADGPRVYPATPFARRRHLFQRMLLISREAVMSSRRIVASCAAMGVVVLIGGWYGVAAFPLRSVAPPPVAQAQPRDLRPGEPGPASSREIEIVNALNNRSPTMALSLELARLQEARGATKDAESTLIAARTSFQNDKSVLLALASLYNRSGQFEECVATLEQMAAAQAGDPQAQHLVASFYEEKVRKDTTLSSGDRLRYLQSGLSAEDRALALNPDYVDAMIIKNILLRHQANSETNRAMQAQLIAEADQLRTRAIELQGARRLLNGQNQPALVAVPGSNGRMPPPPPPPPPPPGQASLVDGQAPVRVGGNIKQPTKTLDVPPVYPPVAQSARVSGVVIMEVTIGTDGSVRDAKVLRSIPLLDQAAIDAVKQWQFTPTLLNGQPVPVVMTATVNFALQ